MTALDLSSPVAVVGTGTMGQGIAQVALVAGHPVRLYDAAPGRAGQAADAIGAPPRPAGREGPARPPPTGTPRAAGCTPAGDLAELADCRARRRGGPRGARRQAGAVRARWRTSSATTACSPPTPPPCPSPPSAGALRNPGRFVGLHFFNPAPLLPLVEVVSGVRHRRHVGHARVRDGPRLGQDPGRCADTPGFIVNRIARPFYAEAFAVYEEQAADPATIDAVLRESRRLPDGRLRADRPDRPGRQRGRHPLRVGVLLPGRAVHALARPAAARRVGPARPQDRAAAGTTTRRAPSAPEPHTADAAAEPPAYVVAEGDLGPAARAARADPRGGHPGPRGGGGPRHPAGAAQRRPAGPRRRADLASSSATSSTSTSRSTTARPPGRPVRLPGHRARRRSAEAIGLFQALGKDVSVIGDVPGMIVARTVAMHRRPRARRRRQGRRHRGGHRHRDAARRQLPARARFEWSRRLGRDWAYDAPGRPARARPHRPLRAVPARSTATRTPTGEAGGHLMTTAKRDTYTPETLLSVAVQVFNERGYDGTSMEHLSKAAGISKSSIYHHVRGQGGAAAAARSAGRWTASSGSSTSRGRCEGAPSSGWSTSRGARSRC